MMQELVKDIIETHYNRFFKCGGIVNYIIAQENEVSFSYLMDCRKRVNDPFDKYRRGLAIRVARVLGSLKNEGYIEKYSSSLWRIVG